MAWTTPPSVSTSDDILASHINDISGDLNWLHDNTPSVRVTHNAGVSTATGADRVTAFNTERWDTDTMHDTVTNNSRLTCKTAGVFHIYANIEWATTPATYELKIKLNGSTIIAWKQGTTKVNTVETSYKLAVNDYVELYINPASTQTLNSTANYSPEFGMDRTGGGA